MMAPHHQGAVDMAEIFLKNGKDPELRRIAEKTVVDQGREILEPETWLEEHPAHR